MTATDPKRSVTKNSDNSVIEEGLMSKYWFLLILILSASSAAQQQSHRDAAIALFDAKHTEDSVQQTLDRFVSQMPELQTKMGVPKERQAKSEQHMEEVAKVIMEVATYERMRDYFATIYTEVFTEDELRELVHFYTSPIGKKYVQKQPELAQAAMGMTGEMMRELMPRLKEISSKANNDDDGAETEVGR